MPDFKPFDYEKLDRFIASKSGVEPDCQAAVAERQRRQLDRAEHQAHQWHQESEREAIRRHQEVIADQQSLKAAVDRLAKPHWVLWATLAAGVVAALAAAILLFR